MKNKINYFPLLILLVAASFGSIAAQTSSRSEQGAVAPVIVGERVQFYSAGMGENRASLVYVPPGAAASKKRFPVIYTLDGDSSFLHTVSAASFLAANGLMPEAIVVGVANTDRIRDFTPMLTKTNAPPPGIKEYGGADKFLAYLGDELVPYLDKNYPTQPHRVLIGHSLGGLFTVHAMVSRPELFRGYVTMEPALWWDNRSSVEGVKNFFGKTPDYSGRLVMAEAISVEGWRNDWANVKQNAPARLKAMLIDIPKESHETMAYRGRYEALQRMFEDYVPQFKASESKATLAALEEQYSALSKDYGYPVEIPESALIEVASRLSNQKNFAPAVATLERAAAIYPLSERVKLRLEEAKQLSKTNPQIASTALKNANVVKAKDAAEFIGVWEGTLKTEPGMPAEIVVAIEVKDEILTGYMVARGVRSDGGDLRLDISSFRVNGKSFEWERLDRNGGRHVHAAELTDSNTLKGTVVLHDHPPFPPGFTPPKVTFVLKRKNT